MAFTRTVDTSAYAQMMQKRIRLGRYGAIFAGGISLVLVLIAHRRGDVLGFPEQTIWRLPLVAGLIGMIAYLVLSTLRSGRAFTRGRIIERSKDPRSFFLHILFLVFSAAVVAVGTVVLTYLKR
jgi:hypothetical protein